MGVVAKETVQILAIVFFSILVLGGVLFLITGCVFVAQTEAASPYFDPMYRVPGILALISGVFLIIGALLGLFGSILLGMWLLVAGIVFVFVALVVSLFGGAYAYSDRHNNLTLKWDVLQEHMNKYNEYKEEVDRVQHHYRCCGYDKPLTKPPSREGDGAKLPSSCCRGRIKGCNMESEERYESTCRAAMKGYMRSHGVMLLGLSIIVGLFEILALVFGIMFVVMFWGKKNKGQGEGGGGGENK